MGDRPLRAWSSFLGQANAALAWIGGIAMIFMVVVIMAGVVMRYVVGQPILGLNEMIQLTAVALVMSALPYCTEQQAHVRVDILDQVIGRWGRLIGDVVSRSLSVLVLSMLSYRAALKALDAQKWADTTNMLRLSIWPFYAILAFGAALCVVVLLVQLWAGLTQREDA